MINWWDIKIDEPEIERIVAAIRNKKISQGTITEEFEKRLADLFDVPYVACTTSGTTALMLSCLVSGIRAGDEVIVPNRTYIATAHGAALLGAHIKLVDVLSDRPLIDPDKIEAAITPKTKAIMPVHLNGRACDMDNICEIAKKNNLIIIEDAAQAFLSQNTHGRYLGTMGRFGCFSLGMAKMITTGQGGFLLCHTKQDYDLVQRTKNQGVVNVGKAFNYDVLAGNFKFTDIQAAIGLAQLDRIENRKPHQVEIYRLYREGLKDVKCLKVVEVKIEQGEIPLRAEWLATSREKFIELMREKGVDVCCQIPSLHDSPHLEAKGSFPHSKIYADHLLVLPSGPDQPFENIKKTIETIKEVDAHLPAW